MVNHLKFITPYINHVPISPYINLYPTLLSGASVASGYLHVLPSKCCSTIGVSNDGTVKGIHSPFGPNNEQHQLQQVMEGGGSTTLAAAPPPPPPVPTESI